MNLSTTKPPVPPYTKLLAVGTASTLAVRSISDFSVTLKLPRDNLVAGAMIRLLTTWILPTRLLVNEEPPEKRTW